MISTAAPRPFAGIAARLVAAALLAIMFACAKLAQSRGVHVIESIFWRQALSIPLMLVIVLRGPGLAALRTGRPGAHGLRMLLGLTGMTLNFLGMTMLPLAEATTIGFSVPLFATLLAALLLGEQTGPWRWGAVLIGFAGVLIVVQPGAQLIHSPGALVALTGALVTATVSIQISSLGRTETAASIVFWFTLTSMAPLGLAMLWFAAPHDMASWGLIGVVAVTGALAQWTLTESLRLAPVSVVLPMDYSSLLWATLLGWLFFADLPTARILVGAPIIAASGLIILWRERLRGNVALAG
jgi:drug/metabolite transporter (DMT)-like permease